MRKRFISEIFYTKFEKYARGKKKSIKKFIIILRKCLFLIVY